MKVILETKRLILRKMTNDDFSSLKKVINSDDGYTQKWIDWCLDSYRRYGFGHYAVIYKESREMIGSIGISMQIIDDSLKPEIGYHLREDYRHQGLAKEAALMLEDYFFNNFDYDEVYSYMLKDNVPSYKTAEAIGMKYLHNYVDKKGNDCRVYCLTRQDWLYKKKRS